MKETASDRIVREAAREVAREALLRIRARLVEATAAPRVLRRYEAEWTGHSRAWPTRQLPAGEWVPYMEEDFCLAKAEFNACGGWR